MTTYAQGILEAFDYLLAKRQEVLVIGQGLWSPWYVGETMTDLEKKYGQERVIDTPVSELATTGAALGAALCGKRPIVTHPRVDFALLALDQIVNQAAKWSSMFGGSVAVPVTYRLIINRGGEQGAQHSQNLAAWFAHIPGLRVVTPATAADARDMLIAATVCDDPVVYIDDRWCYDADDVLPPVEELPMSAFAPRVVVPGNDLTIVGCGWTTRLAMQASALLQEQGVSAEVIDQRTLRPFDSAVVAESVERTGRLLAVDGDWQTCGVASEVLAGAFESVSLGAWKSRPRRLCLADAPAPTSRPLETAYYPSVEDVVRCAKELIA